MQIEKTCAECGAGFYCDDSESWKKICISCFKKKKAKERCSAEKIVYVEKIVKEKIPSEILSRIIRLCHPDKHSNSQASNEITAWLLSQRERG